MMGRKKKKPDNQFDLSGVLNEKIPVKKGGLVEKMTPLEAGWNSVAAKAVKGDVAAAVQFLKLCREYDLIGTEDVPGTGGVMDVPLEVIRSADWSAVEAAQAGEAREERS